MQIEFESRVHQIVEDMVNMPQAEYLQFLGKMAELAFLQESTDDLVIDALKTQRYPFHVDQAGKLCARIVDDYVQNFLHQENCTVSQDEIGLSYLIQFLQHTRPILRCLGFFRWALRDQCDTMFRSCSLVEWCLNAPPGFPQLFAKLLLKSTLEVINEPEITEDYFTLFNLKWFFPKKVSLAMMDQCKVMDLAVEDEQAFHESDEPDEVFELERKNYLVKDPSKGGKWFTTQPLDPEASAIATKLGVLLRNALNGGPSQKLHSLSISHLLFAELGKPPSNDDPEVLKAIKEAFVSGPTAYAEYKATKCDEPILSADPLLLREAIFQEVWTDQRTINFELLEKNTACSDVGFRTKFWDMIKNKGNQRQILEKFALKSEDILSNYSTLKLWLEEEDTPTAMRQEVIFVKGKAIRKITINKGVL